jgi:hypothetical protein
MIADPEVLRGLLKRVKAAEGPDRRLDTHLHLFMIHGVKPYAGMAASPDVHTYTRSVDAALWLVGRALPGWWVTSGLCSLSGHASIGPDYNCPAAERLKAEFPPEQFDHGGFDADLSPGDGPHRQCYAILAALLTALLALSQPDRLPETATGGETE